MPTRIISTSTSSGITLASTDNPVTITPSGYVSGPDGVVGPAGTSFTITNQNTVLGTVKYGITLAQGGTVINDGGALISGPLDGIVMYYNPAMGTTSPGLVVNSGSIVGTGADSYGVYLASIATVGMITNAAGGVIQGGSGVKIAGANAVVDNQGLITGTSSGFPGYGVYLRNSGTVLNGQNGPSTATIEGYVGVALKSSPITLPGTVYNYGTILGTGGETGGVSAAGGGVLINGGSGATAALIQGGRYGVYFGFYPTTITNFATIEATGNGAGYVGVSDGTGPVSVNNFGPAALISGYVGVNLGFGTVTNSGTIASSQGASGVAVNFIAYGNLVVDPGAYFIGTVAGGLNNSNTIELSGDIPSTITNVGTSFSNFGTMLVDPGAMWTMFGPTSINDTSATGVVTIGAGADLDIAGVLSTGDAFTLTGGTLEIAGTVAAASSFNLAGGTADLLQLDGITGTSFDNAITGFGPNDSIDLSDVTFAAGGSVTVGSGTISIPLQNGGSFTFTDFTAQGTPIFEVGAHTVEDIACFAAGTRIRTDRGDVPVESLRVGDTVVLADGGTEIVIWLGHRTVDCAHHSDPETVWPVRIRAGALAPGLPMRDLVLSPEHALYLNDVMIPVRALVNRSSIIQEQDDRITYYHVELPLHEVLLAEGVAAESYLDTGNRSSFAGSSVTALFPNFGLLMWEVAGRAPLTVVGPAVTAARDAINARAGSIRLTATG